MSPSRRIFLAGAAATLACQKRKATVTTGSGAGLAEFAETTIAGSRRRFPNPSLTTHDGRPVRFYDEYVRGRFVLINFAYTRCEGKCPRGLSILLAARSLLAPAMGYAPAPATLTPAPDPADPPPPRRHVA